MMTDEEMYVGYAKDMAKAIENATNDHKVSLLIDSYKQYNYNINHPDFPKEDKEIILDIMNRYPIISFYEHCIITSFQTIREESVTCDIVPQNESDVKLGEINLLDNIK
jgi:hypothetical protein